MMATAMIEPGIRRELGPGERAALARQRAQRLLQRFDAAQAAGGNGRAVAHPVQQPVDPVWRQGRARDPSRIGRMDVGVEQGIVARDQSFGKAEALDEIGDVGGRRHQHGIACAIIFDRDRHFLGQRAVHRVGRPVRGEAREAERRDGDGHAAVWPRETAFMPLI